MLPESIASITSRPPAAPALEVYSIGLGGADAMARSTEMNCAEAIRRGLPSTASVKSSARRSDTGRPVLVDDVDVDRHEIDVRPERGRGAPAGSCGAASPSTALRASSASESAAANPFMA